MPTPNEILVAEEEQIKKDDERFKELNGKSDIEKTTEEKQELGELKERYGKRMQKKIDKMNWETKTLQEALEKERQDKERIAEELEKEKKKPGTIDTIKESYVEIKGKSWKTDETLRAEITTGKITDDEAVRYQRDRNREEDFAIWEKRQDEKEQVRSENIIRLNDAQKVLNEHPNFAKFLPDKSVNPDFSPDDPLYKLTNEIYLEGYARIPDGLSKALKRAKQILRVSDAAIERDAELNLDVFTPENRRFKEKEVVLTEAEKNTAESMFCRGDVMNPKTNRPYTVQEAHSAALTAKKNRLTR